MPSPLSWFQGQAGSCNLANFLDRDFMGVTGIDRKKRPMKPDDFAYLSYFGPAFRWRMPKSYMTL
jgi:hypothetical protein